MLNTMSHKPACRGQRPGFTLVELLVVIAIIGTLLAILLPAVQASREAGRRAQCANNVKQIGVGCLQHLEKFKRFPSGGWGEMWVGLPHRGTGEDQPGGWIYNILPFLDQQTLHDRGMSGTVAGEEGANFARGSAERIGVAVATLYCPSRRDASAYPAIEDSAKAPHETDTTTPIQAVGRTDYAANGGTTYAGIAPNAFEGPPTLADGADGFAWPDTETYNGIIFLRSQVKPTEVKDGLSKTYLVGEKYVDSDCYTTGTDPGDDATAYSGAQEDTIRWVGVEVTADVELGPDEVDCVELVPIADKSLPEDSRIENIHRFGSAHSIGAYFVLCDGSVQFIPFTIDPKVHSRLGNRADLQPVDFSQF